MLTPLFQKLGQFRPLSDFEKQLLTDAVEKTVDVAPKEDIARAGDPPRYAHLLLSGWACRYKLMPSGERQIMTYLISGDLCDLQGTVFKRVDHALGALSNCRFALFPIDRMAAIIEDYPSLGWSLWWSLLVDEAILREWVVALGKQSAEERVAHLICEMLLRSQAVGLNKGDSFELPLTQEELADTMGLSTVHMNRTLQGLRLDGVITSRGKWIVVNDLRKLMLIGSFNSSYLHQESGAIARTQKPPGLAQPARLPKLS